MSFEWKTGKLGNFIELKRGYDLPQAKRVAGEYPLVSSSGVTDYIHESMAKAPGVITGRYGTIGKVFYVEKDFWPLNTTLYVKDFKENDPLFISYFLKTLDFFAYSDKAAVPGVNRNHLHEALVLIPDLKTQKEIASILSSLDNRISLLRETNTTLEAIAQTLFKSWFVDFDPVKAKAQGKQPEGMDEATAALFPSEFEESALGLIPKGWSECKIESLLELCYGKALKATDRIEGEIPVYGSGGVTGYHNKALINDASIVVGRKGTVGTLYWEDRPFFPIDTVFYVKTNKPLTYCFYLLQTLGLEHMNTDAAVPGLNRNNVYRLKFCLPTDNVLMKFDGIVALLREKLFTNNQQSQTLTTLRDTLLPRLISGQLRINQVQDVINEVGA